jgi:hypothetical protein
LHPKNGCHQPWNNIYHQHLFTTIDQKYILKQRSLLLHEKNPSHKKQIKTDLQAYVDKIMHEVLDELKARCKCRNCGDIPGETNRYTSQAHLRADAVHASFWQLVNDDIPDFRVELFGWASLSYLTWRFYVVERMRIDASHGSNCTPRRDVRPGAKYTPMMSL